MDQTVEQRVVDEIKRSVVVPPRTRIPPPPEPKPEPTVEDILEQRGRTHGDFRDNARVSQSLKRIFHTEVGWDRMNDVQREAAHMICLKLSRIITGDNDVKDHWDDIAGYAKLAARGLKG